MAERGEPTGVPARTARRLGYLPRTVAVRLRARPGPPPGDDRGWADLLNGWVERQAGVLADHAAADVAGEPTPCPNLLGRARRLWTLAHLRRHGLGGPRVADTTRHAKLALDRHRDEEYGGYLWLPPTAGDGLGTKVLYGQTMAVYALAELALADPAGAAAARAEAQAVLDLSTSRVVACGAVPEVLDRRWTPLPAGTRSPSGTSGEVTIGGQLHLFEAAALLAATGSGPAGDVARATGTVLHRLFLDRDGVMVTDEHGEPRPAPVSLGHVVEAAWLLADGAPVLGIEGEHERCRAHVRAALDAGFRHGAQSDRPESGWRAGGHQRSWWVQTELLRALVEVDDGPDGAMRETMRSLLRWLHGRQVDPTTGQAWQLLTHWGLVLVTGAETSARTGYHDVRAYVAAAGLLADGARG